MPTLAARPAARRLRRVSLAGLLGVRRVTPAARPSAADGIAPGRRVVSPSTLIVGLIRLGSASVTFNRFTGDGTSFVDGTMAAAADGKGPPQTADADSAHGKYCQGRVIDAKHARQIVDAALGR